MWFIKLLLGGSEEASKNESQKSEKKGVREQAEAAGAARRGGWGPLNQLIPEDQQGSHYALGHSTAGTGPGGGYIYIYI